MKKLLAITTIFTSMLCVQALAFDVAIDYQGNTDVSGTTVQRGLKLLISGEGTYDVSVKTLQNSVDSTKVSIPIDKFYINNNREDIYFPVENEFSILYSGIEGGNANLIIPKIKGYGTVPYGTYNIGLQFEVVDRETAEVATVQFPMQFIVPLAQSITPPIEEPKINLNATNALIKNQTVTNDSTPLVYIHSNSAWSLSLNTDNLGESVANYYVRTIAASSDVTERLQEKVLLQQGKEIVLAKGPVAGENTYVTVEYSMQNKDDKFIPAGNYQNRVKYILREEIN